MRFEAIVGVKTVADVVVVVVPLEERFVANSDYCCYCLQWRIL
jgi:hypothetical protein